QLHPQSGLELGDGRRHRGLGHRDVLDRLGDAARVRGGEEILELAQCEPHRGHGRSLPRRALSRRLWGPCRRRPAAGGLQQSASAGVASIAWAAGWGARSSTMTATAMAATTSSAPMMNPRWYPAVSAACELTPEASASRVRVADSVA